MLNPVAEEYKDSHILNQPPARILIVEDEESHISLINRSFSSRSSEFQLIIAKSISEARENIKKSLPDLIIADWFLSDGKGLDLLSDDKDRLKIPLLIMTSHGDEKIAAESLKAGALDYIIKSYQAFVEMPRTATRALREWGYIIEKLATEEELKKSEAKYRELFNNMSSGVAIYEVKGDGEDFIFRDINQAGEAIDQVRKEDLIGESVLKTFPGVRECGLFEIFQEVWKTGIPRHHPVSMYHDNRITGWRENYVYKLPSGELVSVYDDVTRQRLAEEALKDSQETLASLTESSPVAISWANNKGVIEYCNNRFREIFGYRAEDIPTLNDWFEKAYPDPTYRAEVSAYWQEAINKAIQAKVYIEPIEVIIRCKDGSSRPVEVSGAVVSNRILATFFDLTERKQNEFEMKRALAQINLNILTLSVLNDGIRNPLTVISIIADNLDEEDVNLINVQIMKIDDIITQLDRGFVESDKVRHYLTKHYGIEISDTPIDGVPSFH